MCGSTAVALGEDAEMAGSKRGKRKRGGQERPQGSIRRSQVVTTFGPGAMVDLVNDAVLMGGLDLWNYSGEYPTIPENRLRARIYEALQRSCDEGERVELSLDQPFRAPPAGEDKSPSRGSGIRAIEFPRWFVCQSCRALVRKDQLEYKGKSYRHYCLGRKNGVAVPVRFVSACKRGHLQDFPWLMFAHKNSNICSAPQLFLDEGASGDFSEVRVRCEGCGHPPRRLSEAKNEESMPFCQGHRPWLGYEASQECEERQKLIVRTASNSYFPQIMSALTIPDPDDELRDKIEPLMHLLRNV